MQTDALSIVHKDLIMDLAFAGARVINFGDEISG